VAVLPVEDVVRFGLFELDLKGGQLSRNGSQLRLPQQPLQLLAVLLERPGEIVTRDELRQRLWPSDVFVDFDHGLNKSVQKLRDALGDSATSPRYIETIPRVGYRFIAPVRNGTPAQASAVEIKVPPRLPDSPPVPAVAVHHRARWWFLSAGVVALGLITVVAIHLSSRVHPSVVKYTKLTDFTDSASTPALSPDGHMLAFIRGGSPFMSADQIYVKVLPGGEARRITNDGRIKYNLAFSPDGSQIAYTVIEGTSFSTYTVSVLGSEPQLLLRNAAGLTWLDQYQYLFSRIRAGLHLGIVTETVSGQNFRELYFPPHERDMAHYSYASPDRQSALVVGMDTEGWVPCKLISIEGHFPARSVGPDGGCTSAGWSPDGSWMYFIAGVEGQSHLWRQRYPDGQPEQMTSGPMEEEGLAVEHDGHSVITSIGTTESSIWIHDGSGERSMSSEGTVVAGFAPPSFARDGKTLYYLLWHQPAGSDAMLWRMMVDSGKSELVFPGVAMTSYDVSPDGKQVVYSTAVRGEKSQLWLAPMDRSSSPKKISAAGEMSPRFGPHGEILFQVTEGSFIYLEEMNQDGSGRKKVVPYPIIEIAGISPGRKWLTAVVPLAEGKAMVPMTMAIPLDGGSPQRLCASYCGSPRWSSSGRFLFIPVESGSETNAGRSLAIPVGPGESLPQFPPGGIEPGAQPSVIPGSQSVDRDELVPGEDLTHFAYVKTTAHRNLYRVTLP